MTKSTRSTSAKNKRGSSAPDEVLYSKITQAEPISVVPAQEPRRVRTKFVVVRPKRIPKVSKSSTPSDTVKEPENRRMKSTAGHRKDLSRADFGFNSSDSKIDDLNVEELNKSPESLGKENSNLHETLGKTSQNLGHNVSPSVIRTTGDVSDNVAAST
ncbi:hypothetical protein A2U01_0024320 [Trifolium medium]|uniref:Uncharacterized protein n=1 Tax=Trifolium medium TaxID=97028 RepID=A0A392NV15_9FABA|nr:hypothetical protein [Trifolium medium]